VNTVLLGAAAAAAAGILAASTGRKRVPGSIPHKRGREGGKEGGETSRSPAPLPLSHDILVLRRSLVSQRWALPNYRLEIHNRTRREALVGRYTSYVIIACFIER